MIGTETKTDKGMRIGNESKNRKGNFKVNVNQGCRFVHHRVQQCTFSEIESRHQNQKDYDYIIILNLNRLRL